MRVLDLKLWNIGALAKKEESGTSGLLTGLGHTRRKGGTGHTGGTNAPNVGGPTVSEVGSI